MSEIASEVIDLIAEREEIERESLLPGARLVEDLYIWGDEARGLIGEVAYRFGTDFSALEPVWSDYFPDGRKRGPHILWLIPAVLVSGFVLAFIAEALKIPDIVATPVAIVWFVILYLIWLRMQGRWGTLKPFTVGDLIAAAERGRWEARL